MSALFDDIPRTDPTPGGYAESSFAFVNRAAGEPWETIRQELEQWHAAFPPDANLLRRFRQDAPGQHFAAWSARW